MVDFAQRRKTEESLNVGYPYGFDSFLVQRSTATDTAEVEDVSVYAYSLQTSPEAHSTDEANRFRELIGKIENFNNFDVSSGNVKILSEFHSAITLAIAAFTGRGLELNTTPIQKLFRDIRDNIKEFPLDEGFREFYEQRISDLRKEGEYEEIVLNHHSEDDFWSFFENPGCFMQAKIFLLDNGNLNAVWKNQEKDLISLQFLGDKTVQFVMFNHSSNPEQVSRVTGRIPMGAVASQVDTMRLSELLKA